MKTLKTILSLFAVAAVFSVGAFAQQTETQAVNVTADVQANLSLSATDITLGTVEPVAVDLAANSNDNGDGSSTGTTGAAGTLDITGTSGIVLDVSWTSATLDNGTDQVTFIPSVYNGTNAVPNSTADNVTLSGGSVSLDIGGEADFSSASPGTYNTSTGSGSPITFTVTYN